MTNMVIINININMMITMLMLMLMIIMLMLMIIMYVCSIDWLVLSTKQKLVHLPKCLNNANNLNRTFLQYHHYHHHHYSSILDFKQNSLISGKNTSPQTQNFACVYFNGSTRTRCSWWKWWGWWLKVMTRKWWRSQSQGSSRLSKVPPTHPPTHYLPPAPRAGSLRKKGNLAQSHFCFTLFESIYNVAILLSTLWVSIKCAPNL